MADKQPIPPEQLREAVEWIRDHIADHGILVYCNAGVGRSPSVVVAYLCCVLGFSFGEAVEYVARRKNAQASDPYLLKAAGAALSANTNHKAAWSKPYLCSANAWPMPS
jgi:protein-tyrosine phosphatase